MNSTYSKGKTIDLLCRLPDNVLIRVFEIAGSISKTDLYHIALLNKKYHSIVDTILYEKVHFNGPGLPHIFNESLNRRPRRGSAIQDITLEYPSSELSELLKVGTNVEHHYDVTPRENSLSRALSVMSNLKNLTISVPVTLAHGIGTLFNGPFDLACLKTCTLFYQTAGDEYWDLQDNIHIFAHPSLESLCIKRAKLDYRGFGLIERPHETALKKLHLIECDINDDALSDLLEFPEALKEFVMTQTPDPVPALEESGDDIGGYIMALREQAPSLETITIDFTTLAGRKTLRMRDFAGLKTLRINWDYQLFGASSKKPRMHSVGLPPELETLEFFNDLGTDEVVTDLLVSTIQTKSILARKWNELTVVADDDERIPQEIADACKEQGLKLVIIGGAETNIEASVHDLDA